MAAQMSTTMASLVLNSSLDCDRNYTGSCVGRCKVHSPQGTLDGPPIARLLVAEYQSLLSYSRRLTSDGPEAKDLVQMVCARALSQRTLPANVVNPAAWLRTILFRMFVDFRRRMMWEIPMDTAALLGPVSMPETETRTQPIPHERLRALIASLPDHYRIPYELFTFQQMPYARIAVNLRVSSKTVATRINRARRKLRVLLQEQGAA
jgi:RNA polymerase sigma-70 factor (ECF subfamily)